MKTQCETCDHWTDFKSLFDDPLEPGDIGSCHFWGSSTSMNDTCEQWEPRPELDDDHE